MENTVSLSTSKALALAFAVGLLVGGVAGYSLNSLTGGNVSKPSANGQPSENKQPQGEQPSGKPPNKAKTDAFDTKGDPVLGAQDAPVVIAYWSDYQCSYCRRFELNTFPQIVDSYVRKGEVKIVYKDMPILGPRSRAAALLSQSAWIQAKGSKEDRWWDWHHEVYAKQSNERVPLENVLLGMLENHGINPSSVSDRLGKNKSSLTSEVKEDLNQARSVGINGTPGFVIYRSGDDKGTLVIGAQPFSKFKSVIESELSEES